jgi:hypothetical protein
MESKFRKYIWIASCSGIAILYIVFMALSGMLSIGTLIDRLVGPLAAINIANILIFTTAVIRELNLNKVWFYVTLALSLLALAYGVFFPPSWL